MNISIQRMSPAMISNNSGGYVDYDDHLDIVEGLEAKIDKLEAEIESLKELLKGDAA